MVNMDHAIASNARTTAALVTGFSASLVDISAFVVEREALRTGRVHFDANYNVCAKGLCSSSTHNL